MGLRAVLGAIVLFAGVARAQPYPAPWPEPQPAPYPAPWPQPAPPPQPAPQPYPQPPPPRPVQRPMVVASEAKEPAPFDKLAPPRMGVLMHALCPSPETDPMCGGGIWVGMRDTRIYNAMGGVGLALDLTGGFSFGGGFEVGSQVDIDDRDEMGYGSLIGEVGIGPGFRLGTVDLMPVLGVGGELIGWNSSKDSDDEGFAEGYWYGLVSAHFALGGGTGLQFTAARKLKTRGFERWYGDKIEVMFEFSDKKEPDPIGVGVWYWNHDSHLVVGLAFSVVPRDRDDKKRRLAEKKARR